MSSEENLLKKIRAAEDEMAIGRPFTSYIEDAYENLQFIRKNEGGQFKDLTNEQVDIFANTMLQIYGLPKERKINIVNEVKSYRFYFIFCYTDKFQLICDVNPNQSPVTK